MLTTHTGRAVSLLLFIFVLFSTTSYALFDHPIYILPGGNSTINETDPVFTANNATIWQNAVAIDSGTEYRRTSTYDPIGGYNQLNLKQNTSTTYRETVITSNLGLEIYRSTATMPLTWGVLQISTAQNRGVTLQSTENLSLVYAVGFGSSRVLKMTDSSTGQTINITGVKIQANGTLISDVCHTDGTNCPSLGIVTDAQLQALNASKLNLTDQRYNDTTAIAAKASPGTCAAGTVVQNTTTGGVECITMSVSSSGIMNGTDATLNNVNITNLTAYNRTVIRYNASNYIELVSLPPTTTAPSYENSGGRGDRTGIITVSTTFTLNGGSVPSQYVNGKNGTVFDNLYFNADPTPSGKYMRFDFGSQKIVTEARWFQDITTSHANIKWQGSNDQSSWTDIGSTFRLGGATQQLHTQLNGNTNAYRYYQFIATDNTYGMSNSPYTYEIDFKLDVPSTATNIINSVALGVSHPLTVNGSLTVNGAVTGSLFNGKIESSNVNNSPWIPYNGATNATNLNGQNLTNVGMLKVGTTADSYAGTYPQAAFIYKDQNTVPSQNTAAGLTQMVVTKSNASLQTIGQYMSVATWYNNENHATLTGLGLQFTHFGGGNVTYGRGVLAFVQNVGGGRIDNAYANQAFIQSSAGNITNGYAYVANSPVVSTSGTITNLYGVYIQPQNITNVSNAWGLYQQGTTDINYIAGRMNMGAGTFGQSVTLNMSNTTGGVCRQTFDDGVMVSFTGCN